MENLALGKAARRAKKLMNVIWVTILTLLWLPLNAAIAIFLSNLSNLGSVWPAFQRQLEGHHVGWAIVQGIASPAITSVVYLVLPIVFRRLSTQAGATTKTLRERYVLNNLYIFFTFNNLIVFSLFSALWAFVTAVIGAKNTSGNTWDAIVAGQFYLRVTTSLCQVSPFWITWLLQRNLGAAIDLAQLWTLTWIGFARTFLSPTPRQNIEWTAPPPFDYASYYNYFLFYATIALCFSTLQPIVLPVTALYFALDAVLKKYLVLYVFVTKTESGGQAWRLLFDRMVFATILSNVLIGMVVKARGSWVMVFAILPLPFLMIAFKWGCRRTFDDKIKFIGHTRMRMWDKEDLTGRDKSRLVDGITTTKFRHPAMYKPLITPMVHAKARHVLAQVYHGRLNSEAGRPMRGSDIAMEPMTGRGDVRVPKAPFEIVPEAQQDFSYFKNRSDFREDGGGISGRAEDLVSERSRTPASFGGDEPSMPVSRAASPSLDRTGIPRKALNERMTPFLPGRTIQSSSDTRETETGDLGLSHGRYTDPYEEDRINLLRNAEGMAGGNMPTPTPGEFMPTGRWRSEGTTSEKEPASYDYFRARG